MTTRPADPRRPRGRPRTVCDAAQPGSTISAYVPAAYHDQLIKVAQASRQSVSTLVRRALARSFSTDK